METATFEQKLEASKKLLDKLMDPAITLEKSLKFYEDGIKEIKSAQKMIEEAKVKIELIEKNNNKVKE
jgi:exodeoxyribonuclease VII small subunit